MSIEAVLGRMAAIDARFGSASAPRGATAAPSVSFDDVLAAELNAPRTESTARPHGPACTCDAQAGVTGDYAALFQAAGAAHDVDPALLAAVAQVESGMNPSAVSPAGAQGLMQLMPGTAADLGVADPFDPAQAVDGAARLLRSHLDRFGTVELALAAYNAGAGAVSRHGGIPPYPETQAYVRRVLDHYGATT